jgi:rRNA-processing protein FCF1
MLLRSGKTIDEAIQQLDDLVQTGLNDVSNLIPHIGSPSFEQLIVPAVLAYERWTQSTQKQLRAIFRDGPVIDRLRAEKYWIIVGSTQISSQTASMLYAELAELRSYFAEIANDLRVIKARFPQTSRWVLDTNGLLHYYRLDSIPWRSIYSKDAHIMIPHVVIDEIDSKSYSAGPSIQRRARGVYRMLEQLLEQADEENRIVLRDGTVLEVLADDPDEPRLPNNDDEIVARAVALQQIVYPGKVTVITRDIGMRTRALAQGLTVAKIPDKYLIREDKLSTSDLNQALTAISLPATSRVGVEKLWKVIIAV